MIVLGCLAAVHVLALAWIARSRELPASRRHLAAALALTVPVGGPLLAALALRTAGAGTPSVDALEGERPARATTPTAIAAAASRPAALERITTSTGERRAVMATLARRCDSSAVALLRWTIERSGGEAAIDAALTLEDITRRLEERLASAQARVADDASAEAALAAGDAAAALVEAGIADAPMVRGLADEAVRHWRTAGERGADRCAVAERRARLELTVQRPDAALEALAQVEPGNPGTRERLAVLFADAAFASRQGHALSAS